MRYQLAIVQHPPVMLNLQASLETAIQYIDEAAAAGANLVILPEAFLPGYPSWIWRLRPGGDMGLLKELHTRLLANAVDIDGGQLQPLCDAAARNRVTVVCGMSELDSRYSRSTLYNTVVVIGSDGVVLNRHRKLIPSNPERMVWGRGDASGLRVVETPVGRIGTLMCWENYMPLARYALYAQGIDLYIAPTWDCGDAWLATMRHIAREAGCWVVGCASAIQAKDIPEDFPGRSEVFPDEEDWLCSGDSVVVAPMGGPVAGPHHREQSILYAEFDPGAAAAARRSLDVSGHYNRPDIFQVQVNRTATPPIRFIEEGDGLNDARPMPFNREPSEQEVSLV
jgi:nitrilase